MGGSELTEGEDRALVCGRCRAAPLANPHSFLGWIGEPSPAVHKGEVPGPWGGGEGRGQEPLSFQSEDCEKLVLW